MVQCKIIKKNFFLIIVFIGPPGLNGAPGLPGDLGMFAYYEKEMNF
jgi:hypothetical protein